LLFLLLDRDLNFCFKEEATMSTEPKRIGKYELQQWLGRGEQGEVWKALDTQLRRHVAIKLFRTELQSDSRFVTRFQQRAQMIAPLHHPNIIEIFDIQTSRSLETDDTTYIVMAYVEGPSLDQYIHRTDRLGKLPSATDIVDLFIPICLGLDYAHHKGIAHRNIKPSNILLDRSFSNTQFHPEPRNPIGEPLLTDFGIATLGASTTNPLGPGHLRRYHYCSPEQAKGLPGGKQSDLYSLGIVLYEFCTGTLPFQGSDPTAILTQHHYATPTSPTLINAHIPPALALVILQSLAKDPADRFSSASSMAMALCQALDMPIPENLRQAAQSSAIVDGLTEFSPRTSSQPLRRVAAEGSQSPQILSPDSRQITSPLVDGPGMSPIVPSASNTPAISSSPLPMPDEQYSFTPVQGEEDLEWRADTRADTNIPTETGQLAHRQQQPSESQPISLVSARVQHFSRWLASRSARLLQPFLQPSFRGKWRGAHMYNVLLIILAFLLIIGGFSRPLFSHQDITSTTPAIVPPNDIGVIQAPDGEYIGISDGIFAFDTQRPGGKLKTQAAEYLKAKDFGSADSLWQQAVTQDTNDAETLIYMEDRRILDAGDPYITIVVATTLTGDANSLAVGHANVQAAYIAQKEYNTASKLPGGVKVRLLIANSGGVATYATTVAQQIVRLAQKDKTIMAVMGWTFTAATLNAIGVLSAAKIPMVTNSGADVLTGRSSYFFRVTLPASTQGSVGALYAEQSIHARKAAVFVDEKNNFVLSLANGFKNRFTSDGNTIVATENYTVGQSQTLSPLLQDALSKHPDVIYFAGYPGDTEGVLSNLRPSDPIVLGGSSLYQLEGYSAKARKGLAHLRFTAYSYPDEWEKLGLTAQKPAFFADYQSTYDPNSLHLGAPYGYDRPDGTTLEMYDAISVLLYTCSIALAEKSSITGSDLQYVLTQVKSQYAFQGVTSQISFGSDSNPTDRAIVIICVAQGNFLKMDGIYGKFLVGEANRAQISTPSVCT
jgi:serine/threonine protein kinase/ABC-type branched-subunit amino acid transport system substrate-binding protein